MVYGMENYIKILAVAIVLVFAGCKDWLDVTPAGQATESDLFSTGDGYRSVLNGLYKSMGKPELYGRNWSYGMLDCMAQLYNLESGSFNDEMCKAAAKYEYTNTQVSSSIESAWGIAYNIIANANDLLQNIENASNDIFAEGEMERKMITGEAYACRALIHFELLRLFAPAPVNDDGRAYIPYIESYPVLSATKLGVKPVLEKVIADLEKARGLVAVYDTTINGQGINLSGTGRFNNDFTYNYQTISGQQIEDFDAALIDDVAIDIDDAISALNESEEISKNEELSADKDSNLRNNPDYYEQVANNLWQTLRELLYNEVQDIGKVTDKEIFHVFCDNIVYFSVLDYVQIPDMIPYFFPRLYNVLESIAETFEMELPNLPSRRAYKDRFLFYYKLAAALMTYREEQEWSSAELCAFLYDFAPKFVGGTNWIWSKLPEPSAAFVIGAPPDADEWLSRGCKENSFAWQGNPETQPGDVILLYQWTPTSAFTSIW